jgi:hypothetical protein
LATKVYEATLEKFEQKLDAMIEKTKKNGFIDKNQ